MTSKRRTVYIVRNSARCAHCGVELVSNYRRDKKYHSCRPLIWFEITGGDVSLRRRFYPDQTHSGFVDTSLVRNAIQDGIAEPTERSWDY